MNNINYQLEGFRRAEADRKTKEELEKELAESCNEDMDIMILRELYIRLLIQRAENCTD